jgi:hypothetical protein
VVESKRVRDKNVPSGHSATSNSSTACGQAVTQENNPMATTRVFFPIRCLGSAFFEAVILYGLYLQC